MDVARIEKVEAELDSFIEKRARQNAAENAREELWKTGVRKYHQRHREAALRQRLEWHEDQLVRLTRTFEELLRRHRVGIRLVEQALGIDSRCSPHKREGEDFASCLTTI